MLRMTKIDRDDLKAAFKDPSEKYLIYIPSGKFQSWDTETQDITLFHSISNTIADNYHIVLLPFIAKKPEEVSNEQFINTQIEILQTFLKSNPSLSQYNLSFIGISLGAIVLAKFLSNHDLVETTFNTCIFISLVLEEHLILIPKINQLYFLYGSNDWIGYLNADTEMEIFGPETYGKKTYDLLITTNKQHKEIIILPEHGHFLEHSEDNHFSHTNEWIKTIL